MGIKNWFKKPSIDFDSIVSVVIIQQTDIYSTRNRYGCTYSSDGMEPIVMPRQELDGTEYTFSVRYKDGRKELIKCMTGSKDCTRLLQIAIDPDYNCPSELETKTDMSQTSEPQKNLINESFALGKNQLSPGKYLIGRDIAPGNYDFECVYDSGYLILSEADTATGQKKEIYRIYLVNDKKRDLKKAFNVECTNGQILELDSNMIVEISKSKVPDIDFRPNPHEMTRLRKEQDIDNRFWKLVDEYKALTLENQKLKEENQRLEEENNNLAEKLKVVELSGTNAAEFSAADSLSGLNVEIPGYIWEEFYLVYYEIPEEVRTKRLDILTTLGDAEEVTEIIGDMQIFDEKAADKLLMKAAEAKMVFDAEMIENFGASADEEILEIVIKNSESGFREEDMQELFNSGVDCNLIFECCERRGFRVPKDVLDELGETEYGCGFEGIVDAINELSKLADELTKKSSGK